MGLNKQTNKQTNKHSNSCINPWPTFFCIKCTAGESLASHSRFDVWEALLQFAASVFENLQCCLSHLLVVHLQTAEERLKRLSRVEGHWVSEGQNLGVCDTHYFQSTYKLYIFQHRGLCFIIYLPSVVQMIKEAGGQLSFVNCLSTKKQYAFFVDKKSTN